MTAASLQVGRAQIQSDTYQSWIEGGRNEYEQQMLSNYQTEKQYREWATNAQAAGALLQGLAGGAANFLFSAGTATGLSIAAGVTNAAAAELGGTAEQAAINAQIAGANASFERQVEQWTLSKQLADADVAIGQQQQSIAQNRAYVATAEATLANEVQANAQAKLAFLQTKFTNAQLYTWMAGVLAGVYRYLLQQAAAVARLAEQQLAFERQAPPAGYIKSDYWTPPSGGSTPATGTRGLTGSARLTRGHRPAGPVCARDQPTQAPAYADLLARHAGACGHTALSGNRAPALRHPAEQLWAPGHVPGNDPLGQAQHRGADPTGSGDPSDSEQRCQQPDRGQ